MKAFEKWLQSHGPGPPTSRAEIEYQNGLEDGWWAALKQLYSRIEKRHTRQEIEDMILEELGYDPPDHN